MRDNDDSSAGAVGMDLFATLFIIFMLLAVVAVAIANTARVPEDRQYLLVGYAIDGIAAHEIAQGFWVHHENSIWSKVSPTGIAYPDSVAPNRVLRTDAPPRLYAVYDNAPEGDYRLVLQFDNAAAWTALLDAAPDAQVCLILRYPNRPDSHRCVRADTEGPLQFMFNLSYWQ